MVRVLAPTRGRDRGHRALQNLQKGLLNPFSADIAGYGWILRFARDLIDLIDIDNAVLSAFDIVIRRLDQLQQDIFHILSHISGFGQARRIRDCKGYIQYLG